jgi:hypothetical protein
MLWWTSANQFHTCSWDASLPVAYPISFPESCVQTMTALPFPFCSQNTRPIAASVGTCPDSSWPTEYLVAYWSEWFQVFSPVGWGATELQTCVFSTVANGLWPMRL